jgi:putative effector of murein hydrolase
MGLVALALTLGAWFLARRVPVIPPIVTASVLIAALVASLGIAPDTYARGTAILVALLAPAIVGLGLPLFRRRAQLLRHLVPTLVALCAGSTVAMITAVVLARVLGLGATLAASLGPRAATAPVAAAIAQHLGADVHLTVAASVAGGVIGAVFAPLALRLGGSPYAGGLALGVASHGIGTARAAALDPTAGAAAAIGMGLNALLTSLLAPVLVPLLLR